MLLFQLLSKWLGFRPLCILSRPIGRSQTLTSLPLTYNLTVGLCLSPKLMGRYGGPIIFPTQVTEFPESKSGMPLLHCVLALKLREKNIGHVQKSQDNGS